MLHKVFFLMKLVSQHNCKKRISLVCENWKHEFMKKSLYCTDPARHTFHNNTCPCRPFTKTSHLSVWGGGGGGWDGFRYKVECPREINSLDLGMGNLKKNLPQKSNNCLHICPPLLFPITAVYCTTHFPAVPVTTLPPPPPPPLRCFEKKLDNAPSPHQKKNHLISLFLGLPSF